MPKRAVTPPPADDEPEFLTVVHPYPLRANPELAGDRKSIVFWLACIAEGHSHLLNIYHKPTSPGMIILEVNKEFDRFEDLLGLHEWSKILKKPDAEEVQCNSKIFYSLYKSARQVTKLGWKQVVIDDSWFVNWSANNTFIQYPYPKSTWCDVPLENKTLAPLCRPLPVIHFPPPPVAVPPPVGSAEWNKLKAEGRLPNAPSKHKGKAPGGAWAKGASTSRAPTSKTASGSRVSQPTREIPPPIIPVTSRPSQAPSIPPGLGIRSNSNALPSMPVLSPGNSGSSSDDSRVLTPDSGLHAPAGGRFNWAEDVENESAYGATSFPGPAGTVHGNLEYAPGPQSFDDSHDDEDHQLPTIHAVDQSEPIPVSDSKNLWADYIEPKEDKILPWKHVCSVHGELCPGKVCKEYTKKLREEKRKEEQAKWDAERRQQRAKKSRQAPQKMTEKEYWARGPAPGPGTAAPKSNSSSTPSSGSSSGVPSRASSRTPSTGPRAPSPAVPPPAPPAQQTSNDPWDNDGQMSSWDADETRSMASTARTGWGDDAASVANDDDGRSVASTRDEWHVSESSTPWDNAPPRPANNAPPASRGTGAWGAPKPAPSSGWGASAAGNNRRGAAAPRGNGGRATVHTQQQRSNGWATIQKPAPANLRANQPQTRGRPPQGAGRGSRGGGQAWGPTRSNVTSTANASVPAAADAASEDGWGNVSSSSYIW